MKRLAAVLLLCSCGHRTAESTARDYKRVQSTFRTGKLAEAFDQSQLALKECGSDAQCAWRFRLLEVEILNLQNRNEEAAALLSQSVPSGSNFVSLELRRRMWQGYLLSFSQDETKVKAGRNLLDDAYAQASKLGLGDLLPEIEILKGNLLWARDREKARALFVKARQHAIEQQDRYNEAGASIDLGMIAVKGSRYDEAIPFFEHSLEIAKRIGAAPMVTVAYQNLALCQTQLGAYDESLKLLRQALAPGAGELPVVRRDLLVQMGRTLESNGELPEALKYYRQALALSRSMKSAAGTRLSASNLASALSASGDWDAAEQANREEQALAQDDQSRAYATLNAATIAAGRKRFDETVALYQKAIGAKVNDPSILWDSYAGLARAYAGAGNKPFAQRYFEKAIQVVDKNQTGLSRDEYKLTFLASLIRFYRDYVEFLMQSAEFDKALEIVESSRSRILAETTTQQKPVRLGAVELRHAAARSGRIYLSYWLAPVQSYVWVITSTRTEHFALGPSARIESLVEASRHSLREWDLRSQESPDARRLYDAVLRPVASRLPPDARVVIVPDGALHYLNFETLPAEGEKPHYWIEDATVAIAPSLAIAAAAPLPKANRHESLLIMGDALSAGDDYARLPYAEVEIGRVGNHFPSAKRTIVTKAEATPAAYRQANPQQFSLIHFSAHGEANAQSPLDSAIILSPKDGVFKLYARDVIDLPLHADLVTISACRSAGARVYSGEGLVGFAWAFLKAGAHYVVAGLWDVTDSSTPDMMDEFYGAMEAGNSPPDALRMAKLSMIRSAKAIRKPYYWGPFQIYIR
jgi:CHAT domain-containing protein